MNAFDTAHTATLDALFETASTLHFVKGEHLLHPANPTHSVFRIMSGIVKLYSLNNQGEEYIHIFYGAGEIFPLRWMSSDTAVHQTVYARALDHVTVQRISTADLDDMIRNDGALSYAILQQVVQQFTIYAERLENLEYKYASERLAFRLLFMAGRFGTQRGNDIVLPSITQHDIAASINISRESANRELERLERKSLISREVRHIVIRDREGLRKELHTDSDPFDWRTHIAK
ncbi:MAG TPA: Crp/Fnr family transcriptional regulator [Candidatus Saccharimonadales bacterium]|nr:Crp/Fnr family transcriptional regulator [Candidatus Saccharimonadales bacterium]